MRVEPKVFVSVVYKPLVRIAAVVIALARAAVGRVPRRPRPQALQQQPAAGLNTANNKTTRLRNHSQACRVSL